MNWTTDGTSVSYSAAAEGAKPENGECDCDVLIEALRVGRPWTKAESAAMPLPVGSPIVYPADACVLLLPFSQPRPEANRRAAQWRAAALTPLALVGDAVVVPFLYIACYGFGQCP